MGLIMYHHDERTIIMMLLVLSSCSLNQLDYRVIYRVRYSRQTWQKCEPSFKPDAPAAVRIPLASQPGHLFRS